MDCHELEPPDPDLVIAGVLGDGLDRDVTVVNLLPDRLLDRLPLVAARTINRDATRMIRFRSYAEIDVQSWALGREAASALDRSVHRAIRRAYETGSAYYGGRIARVEVIGLGTEVRTADQPARVSRYGATYRLTIRPA